MTGGAGYIGSAIALALVDAGHDVVVLDDLSAGAAEAVVGARLVVAGIDDRAVLDRELPGVDVVVHCAARIVVAESIADPLGYHDANVARTIALLRACVDHGVLRVVQSSTAALYAEAPSLVVDEEAPIAPASPYAAGKAMVERILLDAGSLGLRSLVLRYFNPLGADPRGRVGMRGERGSHVLERLRGAWAERTPFTITGVRWPTRDGSGMRDYVHVWDLAEAHVAAVERFDDVVAHGSRVVNLGSGAGTTVRELVAAFEHVVGGRLEVVEGPPRPGDVAGARTTIDRARDELGWTPRRSLEDAIRDALAWAARDGAPATSQDDGLG
ncbi:UDP-glucose 4-epimerase GalE [Agrococcus versicolor]|uniref:UDP-glucose 4-epimerase n=1 Tax=Agrococcus versicolor TaxID=501482 RepID=A0ABN3AKM0_9MICO